MPETVLVTGSNRGIGLAIVKVYLSKGDRVFAACRKPQEAPALKVLQKEYPVGLEVVKLDVDSEASALAAAKEVGKKTKSLDTLLNVAGILPRPHDAKLEDLDFKHFNQAFETNSLGPLRVSRAFLPLLRKAKNPRVVNVTSGAGSISGKNYGGMYAYGTSKAALNMITRTFAFEFKKEGIVGVALDPGWVKTDMGGANAQLTPEFSSTNIVKTAKKLTIKDTSKFIYINGKDLKW